MVIPCSLDSIAAVTDMTVGMRYSQPIVKNKNKTKTGVEKRKRRRIRVLISAKEKSRKFCASLISFSIHCGWDFNWILSLLLLPLHDKEKKREGAI